MEITLSMWESCEKEKKKNTYPQSPGGLKTFQAVR